MAVPTREGLRPNLLAQTAERGHKGILKRRLSRLNLGYLKLRGFQLLFHISDCFLRIGRQQIQPVSEALYIKNLPAIPGILAEQLLCLLKL